MSPFLRLGRTTALPLKNDASSRFLPWLIAPMVLLSTLALAGALMIGALIGRWERDVSGTLTVEIAAAPGEAGESANATRRRVDAAIRLLKDSPGVVEARALSQDQLVALLVPWLGNSDLLHELPLPALIDVTMKPETMPDLAQLSSRLADAVPGASIDDHRVWLSKLIKLSRAIEWMALGSVVTIAAVASLTVVYATRTGMAVHHEVIELLHLIGATDDYIAREFSGRAFALGLKGGIAGFIPTIPLVVTITGLGGSIEGGFFADLSLSLLGWVAVGALPLVAALLAMITARLTVHRTLARMP